MQDFMFKMAEDETYCVSGYLGDEEEVVIPAEHGGAPVTILGDGLFAGHPEIRRITVPDSVTDLGEFVFDGCEKLETLELPSGLERLWGATFARCGLTEITLPDGIRAIPPYAFKECQKLKKVGCGKGLKHIYAWSFGGCDELKELLFGAGVEVSPQAFSVNEEQK